MADIGVFMNLPSADPEALRRKLILEGGLPKFTFDYRYGGGDYDSYGSIAIDLVKSNPDARIFFASCWPTMQALNDAMQSLAIAPLKGVVYSGMTDSTIQSYGANDTGIEAFELADLCPNWPSLLMQIAPDVKRAAVIYDFDRNCSRPCMGDQNRMITDSAIELGLSVDQPIDAGLDPMALKCAIDGFACADTSPAGLIVTSGTLTAGSRLDITRIATSNNLPVIYPSTLFTDSRNHPEAAGLISYGPDVLGLYRRTASEFLSAILSQLLTTADIRNRFQPVPNKDFDLIVNQSAVQNLAANGVQLNVTDTMTVTLNGAMTKVPIIKV
ncbi:MAG TPA: hypothetical protein VLJ17_15305 [Xanthobacteraceae bacterium]|nr:hypothetical protein [Xanthobacteraceae bacterium]